MTATEYRPHPRVAARLEDAVWLLDECGVHPAAVAERLGVTISTLDATFRRAGISRPDIAKEATYQKGRS